MPSPRDSIVCAAASMAGDDYVTPLSRFIHVVSRGTRRETHLYLHVVGKRGCFLILDAVAAALNTVYTQQGNSKLTNGYFVVPAEPKVVASILLASTCFRVFIYLFIFKKVSPLLKSCPVWQCIRLFPLVVFERGSRSESYIV